MHNSDRIVRRDKIKMREMHHAQRPLLLQRQLHEFAASCLIPNGTSRRLCQDLRPNRKRPYVVFGSEHMRERDRGLGFLVSTPRHGMLVKSVLGHTEPVTAKCWVFPGTTIKSRIYSRKHGGFWVESNSDHATNLPTELAGLNNTHRGFFIET